MLWSITLWKSDLRGPCTLLSPSPSLSADGSDSAGILSAKAKQGPSLSIKGGESGQNVTTVMNMQAIKQLLRYIYWNTHVGYDFHALYINDIETYCMRATRKNVLQLLKFVQRYINIITRKNWNINSIDETIEETKDRQG